MKLRAEVHNQVSTREQPSIHSQESMEIQLQLLQRRETKKSLIKQQLRTRQKGYTFGQGRTEFKEFQTPGPGQYQFQMPRLSNGFSIGQRWDFRNKETAPPLGTYEIKGLDRYGYYTNSKFKNACAALFSPPKPHHTQSMLSPGPGDYLLPGSMNDKGVYHVAGYKTKIGFAIGKKSLPQRKAVYNLQ